MSKVKAVVFDLDNTVLRHPLSHDERIRAVFIETNRERGMDIPLPTHKDLARVDTLPNLRMEGMFAQLLPESERGDTELIDGMRARFLSLSRESANGTRALRGVCKLFCWLRAQDIKIGIASNNNIADVLINESGLAPLVDALATSNEVKNIKPHPEVIECALKKLGVSNTETIYVGDHVHDLKAGIDAKARVTLLVTNGDKKPAHDFAHYGPIAAKSFRGGGDFRKAGSFNVINSISEVRDWVKALNKIDASKRTCLK